MENKVDEMIGRKFGLLTVIDRTNNYVFPNGDFVIAYNCRCDCGNNKIVPKKSLKNGNTRSCGCMHTEIIRKIGKSNIKKNTYDLSGVYGIGFTVKGKAFYFDIEDYDIIKDYYWNISKGYVVSETNNNGKPVRMHRLIMGCIDKKLDVDHINHNTVDNRKENLRIVTRSQNQMNMSGRSNNTSGVTGVTFNKSANKWAVSIQKDRQRIHIGVFDCFDEAVKARKEAEIKYFGDYRYKDAYQ